VIGLTHQTTIGRPFPWSASPAFVEQFGDSGAEAGMCAHTYIHMLVCNIYIVYICIEVTGFTLNLQKPEYTLPPTYIYLAGNVGVRVNLNIYVHAYRYIDI